MTTDLRNVLPPKVIRASAGTGKTTVLQVIHDIADRCPLFVGQLGREECLLESAQGFSALSAFGIGLSQIGEAGTQRLSVFCGDSHKLPQRLDFLLVGVGGTGGAGKEEEKFRILVVEGDEISGLFQSFIGIATFNEGTDQDFLCGFIGAICLEGVFAEQDGLIPMSPGSLN